MGFRNLQEKLENDFDFNHQIYRYFKENFENKSYSTGTKMWETTKMRKACSFLLIFLWANCQAFDRSAVEKQHSTV